MHYSKMGECVMKQIRSYRRRGSPDFPLAVYLNDINVSGAHPVPEFHPETELVWLLAGHAVVRLGDHSQSFREGDIFVIPSNVTHHYESFSPDARWCSVVFSSEAITMHGGHFFQTAFTQPLASGQLQLPPLLRAGHPAYDAVRTQLELLLNTRIYTKDYKMRRFGALIAICTTLAPYCAAVADDLLVENPGNETVRQCMCYIHNNHAKKLTLDDLANVCHLHPNYLCALFKEYTGQTVFEYITRIRVESASNLLKNNTLPMGKVGEMVGFRSESLFYRKFKAIMGVSPKAYAKQNQNK